MNTDIFQSLNDQQKLAVNCSLGNKLVLAGAGSGKTRVLTCRVAKLIYDYDVKPSNILALTFTNKASNEMKQRLQSLLKISTQGLWFGTFHGICRRILKIHWKEAGIRDFFSILDSQDQLRIIKRIVKSRKLDDNFYDPKSLQSFINIHKDKGLRHDKCENNDRIFVDIYREYDEICRQTNSVDFADLILLTYEMFKSNSEILKYYSSRFKNIMVDEFQDTNTLQFNLLKLLNVKDCSLYVVGDDDQSIYGWRGARSENIKYFNKQFKEVEIFRLEQNYRSTTNILNVANTLIEKNKDRMGKSLWTETKEGNPVYFYEAYNDDDECSFIVEKIEDIVEKGIKRSDIAILYRSNFLSRRFEEELNSRSIPYKIFGGFRFFERAEIKDVLAYLRVVVNKSDDSSFERTINNPPRGIGEKSISILRQESKKFKISLWDAINDDNIVSLMSSRCISSLNSYKKIIESLSESVNDLSLKDIIEKIIDNSGLVKYYDTKKNEESLSKIENLEELVSTAERFIHNNLDSENLIQDFLDNASLEAGEYQSKLDNDPLQLMTIHSAKGLEFPVVFLTGLDEGIFPNPNRDINPGFLEEERRLCYVAITRAMNTLYLTCSNMRYIHGSSSDFIPSRFIGEIPNDLIEPIKTKFQKRFNNKNYDNKHQYNEFSQENSYDDISQDNVIPFIRVGQKVHHLKFGQGVILSYTGKSDDLKVHINFEEYGKKWLVLSYTQLEFIN